MPDEIIRELYEIKDGIAKECGYDVDALADYLKTRRNGRKQGEDALASQKSREPRRPRMKTDK
jgi:hypothetical protein